MNSICKEKKTMHLGIFNRDNLEARDMLSKSANRRIFTTLKTFHWL